MRVTLGVEIGSMLGVGQLSGSEALQKDKGGLHNSEALRRDCTLLCGSKKLYLIGHLPAKLFPRRLPAGFRFEFSNVDRDWGVGIILKVFFVSGECAFGVAELL